MSRDLGIVIPHPETSSLMPIRDDEFTRIRRFVHAKIGISLSDQKRALVVGRLQPVLHARGIKTFTEYMDYVEGDRTGHALSELVARISTNHTHFYREHEHFDFMMSEALPQVVAGMKAAHDNDFRMWCAASASGEEPYTLQMLLMEFFGAEYAQWNAGLLATDISPKALDTARKGLYSVESVGALPANLRQKYFVPGPPGLLSVREDVKKQIVFRRFNLMRPKFPFNKPFHIVYCRNVMIYFDNETRAELVRKICELLVPGGWLFVGHSETLHALSVPLDYVRPAVYRRRLS